MDGILFIDKPTGWTSFDVVAKVRGLLRHSGITKPKVGHSGTLDPLASGLLVLLIGSYTKQATTLTKLDKTYEVTARLGQTSTTGDEEGDKTVTSTDKPSTSQLHTVLTSFIGDSQQVPPAYSAIKIDGKRAYELARRGKTVQLAPRPIHIYELTLVSYEYPLVRFSVHVSSGTYIRSLVEDIGQKLGCGAYTSTLRRTQIGTFLLEQAISPSQLSAESIYQHIVTT